MLARTTATSGAGRAARDGPGSHVTRPQWRASRRPEPDPDERREPARSRSASRAAATATPGSAGRATTIAGSSRYVATPIAAASRPSPPVAGSWHGRQREVAERPATPASRGPRLRPSRRCARPPLLGQVRDPPECRHAHRPGREGDGRQPGQAPRPAPATAGPLRASSRDAEPDGHEVDAGSLAQAATGGRRVGDGQPGQGRPGRGRRGSGHDGDEQQQRHGHDGDGEPGRGRRQTGPTADQVDRPRGGPARTAGAGTAGPGPSPASAPRADVPGARRRTGTAVHAQSRGRPDARGACATTPRRRWRRSGWSGPGRCRSVLRPPCGPACPATSSLRRPERGDDVAAVGLQLGLLVAVHEVQVELVDPGLRQLAQLGDVLVGLAEDAEPVGHLVAHEGRIGRADLGVVQVVVAGPVGDVAGQGRRQLLARVLVDEVDDVVRDERREPARALAPELARPDMGRRGGLDADRRRVAARRPPRPRGPGPRTSGSGPGRPAAG